MQDLSIFNLVLGIINFIIAVVLIIWFSTLLIRISNTIRTTNFLISVLIGKGKSVTVIDKYGERSTKLMQEMAEELWKEPNMIKKYNIIVEEEK
jgi:hypothetical protein